MTIQKFFFKNDEENKSRGLVPKLFLFFLKKTFK